MRWLIIPFLFFSGVTSADEWPEITFPQNASVDIVSDNMNFMGLPMRTWVVNYRGDASELARFFTTQWEGNSVKFNDTILNGDVIINSWQPPYLLTARVKRRYEFSVAYVGVSQNLSFDEYETNKSNVFPSLNGTAVLSDVSSIDLFKRGRTVVLMNERRVSESYYYYKNYFQSRGWTEVVGILEPSVNQAVLRFNKQNSFMDISLKSELGKTHIVANEMVDGL
ncbi:hypothetical protein MJ923_02055 [Shewanella sp. 3B26]|uniref:Uncharacterized protein n=1 Tax=Shewanella zhuhaiensis TaxID=2919576 RepID=A0AAJ1EZB7_9GAMM|nr:hypothetical protein [Shewanella zhuhaiensis]MCH4293088.1 hypothetical protein [Shewanella zhuhaiensis]